MTCKRQLRLMRCVRGFGSSLLVHPEQPASSEPRGQAAKSQKQTAEAAGNAQSRGTDASEASSKLHKQIMRQMVLNSCVIRDALLGMRRANQVRIQNRRQSILSGIVQSMFHCIRSVAVLRVF